MLRIKKRSRNGFSSENYNSNNGADVALEAPFDRIPLAKKVVGRNSPLEETQVSWSQMFGELG